MSVTPLHGDRLVHLRDDLAEQALLGAVIRRPDALISVDLEVNEFGDPRHQAVYRAMRRAVANGKPPDDLVVLEAELRADGKLEGIGGLPFLSELAMAAGTSGNIGEYANRIRDRAQAREVLILGERIQRLAIAGEPADELVAELERRTSEIHSGKPTNAARAFDLIEEILAESKLPTIPSGFPRLDFRFGGFRQHRVTVLVGPTGGGKTSLAIQMASLASAKYPVIYVALELTRAQLVARALSQRLDMSWADVLEGKFDPREARRSLSHLDLWVIARQPNILGALDRAIAEAKARRPGVPILVVVDYIQLLAGLGEDLRAATRSAQIGLQYLTETQPISMLVLSQASRANSTRMREGGAEAASEYVGTGMETSSIEHSAAAQLVIEMPADDDVEVHEGVIAVAKARYGRQGTVGFSFNGATGIWCELEEKPLPPKVRKRMARDQEDMDIVLEAVSNHEGENWTFIRNQCGLGKVRANAAKVQLLRARKIEVRQERRQNSSGAYRPHGGFFVVKDES